MNALILILSLVVNQPSVITQKENNNADESPTFVLVPQDAKTKIKKEELPEAARKTLEGEAFKGWTVVQAYKTPAGEFEVELKKEQISQTVKFDKEGKVKNEK